MTHLHIQPLTAQNFKPFGHVLSCDPSKVKYINNNRTERYHDLAPIEIIDIADADVRPIISIFKGQPVDNKPFALELFERHPLGSQSFIPINNQPCIVVVAHPLNESEPDTNRISAFFMDGHTGINYFPNTWHHPLLPIFPDSFYTVVDRRGPGDNLENFSISHLDLTLDPTPFLSS